jgi:hypothetical protein
MYNYRDNPSNVAPDSGTVRANFVGNYYKEGPDVNYSRGGDTHIRLIGDRAFSSSSSTHIDSTNRIEYRSGNVTDITVVQDNGGVSSVPRHSFPTVTTTDALTAKTQVLNGAGAALPSRDSVDQQIVNGVINGTGRIIGYPSDVGGWPAIASGAPPADTDHDGMPDSWEAQNGFNSNSTADGPQDADGDGYTNLEEFLNGTNPRAVTTAQLTLPATQRHAELQAIIADRRFPPDESHQNNTVQYKFTGHIVCGAAFNNSLSADIHTCTAPLLRHRCRLTSPLQTLQYAACLTKTPLNSHTDHTSLTLPRLVSRLGNWQQTPGLVPGFTAQKAPLSETAATLAPPELLNY